MGGAVDVRTVVKGLDARYLEDVLCGETLVNSSVCCTYVALCTYDL